VDASTAWEMPACFGTFTCSTGNFWTVLSYYVNVAAAATLKQWRFTELAPHRNCPTGIASSAGKDSTQRLPKKDCKQRLQAEAASRDSEQRLHTKTASRCCRQELHEMGNGADRRCT